MTAPTSATGTRILVTGGVRSGKSRHAESLLLPPALPEDTPVTYLACGPRRDDADWAERVAAHRARRPATWTTVEDPDAATVLRDRRGPVLLDCVGTWLTATLDALHAWDAPAPQWRPALDEAVDELVAAWAAHEHVVAVTNEVGWGVVPAHRSGRVFADQLGLVNQRLAQSATSVRLVVAGRVLPLDAP